MDAKTKGKPKIKLIADYRLMRAKLRLSQSKFWNRIGVNQSCGSRYETGRSIPKPAAILAHLVYVQGLDIDARDYK